MVFESFSVYADRSWARRARGSGRKRADLLSADFSGDRERPNSPSLPVVEPPAVAPPVVAVPAVIGGNARPPVLPSGLTPTDDVEGKPRCVISRYISHFSYRSRARCVTHDQSLW